MNKLNRREALRRTAYIMGGTLMAPTIAGILHGCSAQPGLTWTPILFSEDQARMVSSIADIILPKTDTPSASELGVPKFIEDMVSQVYEEKSKERFMSKMIAFETECKEKMGKSFNQLNAEKQQAFVYEKHAWIAENRNTRGSERPFIWLIKELTISGYFTTEVGMTQILQYKAIPTEYKGCITLEEAGGRTWAT